MVPYWSSDNAPDHFLLRLPIKGHTLCEQRKSRLFHRPAWLFDFPEENCPSTGTGKNKFNKLLAFVIFYVSFSLNTSFKAYGLRHTSGRIRHLWKKDLFWTWLDPGSYPSLCFIPPLRYTLHECVTCLGKRDPLAPAPKKDFHPWCSPESSSHLVKATWGFSCVFAPIVLILVSLCLLLFRDPLFHADVIDSFDQRSGKNVGWQPLHPIWILSCFHPGAPSLNVLFSLVECTASNYSLVEIFVKLFWRWNCHELSCGNIHLAGVDGYNVGATVEDDRDFGVKEFIRWLYAASYRDHQLRYEFFFFQSIPQIVSFKSEIFSEIWES